MCLQSADVEVFFSTIITGSLLSSDKSSICTEDKDEVSALTNLSEELDFLVMRRLVRLTAGGHGLCR